MIKIDDDNTTIRITRGNATNSDYNNLAIKCTYYDDTSEEDKAYEFLPTDKLTFIVYNKKGYTKEEVLKVEYVLKDIGYTTSTTCPELPLSVIDTSKFPLSNKAITYWYTLTLNDDTTILGHDEDGAKKIIVYPNAD